jgi:hypothetical protein
LIIEPTNIAARAQAPLAGAVQDDNLDRWVALPGIEGRGDGFNHGPGQSVQRLRPVERQPASTPLALYDHVVHGGSFT